MHHVSTVTDSTITDLNSVSHTGSEHDYACCETLCGDFSGHKTQTQHNPSIVPLSDSKNEAERVRPKIVRSLPDLSGFIRLWC